MKRLLLAAAAALSMLGLAACGSDAEIAGANLSASAAQFEINRRIVFYNGITDTYILAVEGRCALSYYSGQVSVTCKVGPGSYKRHMLGLSDNVTYFVEQIDAANVSEYHYRVIFKPAAIIPDIEIR